MSLDPTHQSLQINLRSDDPAIQGQTLGDTELLFNFNRTINIPEEYHLNISVASAEIPHSWYTWDEIITISVNWTESQGVVRIIIPVRNWTPCCFANYYKEQLEAIGDNSYPRLTWDPHTLKWTLANGPGGSGSSLTFFHTISDNPFTPTYLSLQSLTMLYKFFGFNVPVPVAGVAPTMFPGTQPFVADSLRFHTVSITSRIFHTSSLDSNQADVGDQHVLAKVPTNAPFGSMILFKGNLKDGYLLRLPKLNAVDLALRDHNGDLINLNGARFNISLLAQFIKRNDFTPIPKDIAPVIDYKNFIRRRLGVGRRRRGR
jgi:hypothetical protein